MGNKANDVVSFGYDVLERFARAGCTAAVNRALVSMNLQRVHGVAGGPFKWIKSVALLPTFKMLRDLTRNTGNYLAIVEGDLGRLILVLWSTKEPAIARFIVSLQGMDARGTIPNRNRLNGEPVRHRRSELEAKSKSESAAHQYAPSSKRSPVFEPK